VLKQSNTDEMDMKGKVKSRHRCRQHLKWSSAKIRRKFRFASQNGVDKVRAKGVIVEKFEKLTLDSVLAMREEELVISPFSTRSQSPATSDHSSLWETISETDEDDQ